jgi:hypothetical protein
VGNVGDILAHRLGLDGSDWSTDVLGFDDSVRIIESKGGEEEHEDLQR